MSVDIKLFYIELESGECMLIRAKGFAEAMEIESSADWYHGIRRTIREATEQDVERVLSAGSVLSVSH